MVGQPVRGLAEGNTVNCKLGNIADKPHVEVINTSASGGSTTAPGAPESRGPRGDSPWSPDNDGPSCAGSSRDPFPSTTVYVIATFVDPAAEHWDPRAAGDGGTGR